MRSSSKRNLSGIEKAFILLLVGNVRNCSSSTVWFQIMLIRNKHHFCCILKLEFSCIEFSKIRKGSFLAKSPVKVIYIYLYCISSHYSFRTQYYRSLKVDCTWHELGVEMTRARLPASRHMPIFFAKSMYTC